MTPPLAPGQTALSCMVADLAFETAADLHATLTSAEMAAAAPGTANFADGGMTLYSTAEIVDA